MTVLDQLGRTARENAETIEMPEAAERQRAMREAKRRPAEGPPQVDPPDPWVLVLMAQVRAEGKFPPRVQFLARHYGIGPRDVLMFAVGVLAGVLLFALIYFIGR
jgi:hypothetical protein